MKKLNSLILIILGTLSLNPVLGQEKPFYESYEWDKNPMASINIDEVKEKDIVAFKDKRVNEFYFIEDNNLVEYSLVHKLFWLNSNDKIEEYNKVYLPYSSGSEMVRNKARVFTKEGKIIELDDSKILTAKDDETQRTYKYYAFEGIQKGSFIEYYYVVRKYPSYTGNRIILQSDFDKKNVEFDLFSPSNLIFKTKSYNGLSSMVKDTLNKEKNHWKLRLKTLDKLEDEEQAAYSAMSKYVMYRLKNNTFSPSKDLVSFSIASQNIYNAIYSELDNKTKTKLKAFITSIPNSNNEDTATQIRAIENFIKTNVYVTDVKRKDLEDLPSIIGNKVANETGIMKLYGAIFNMLEIKHQVVLTTDRTEVKFDKNFQGYHLLQKYLIYFPKSKLYMAPSRQESRLGFPPGNLTDNYGLFIKPVTLGEYTSGVGVVKYIKPVNYDKTNYDLVMNVKFDDEDITTTQLKMDRKMDGYYAVYVQPFMSMAKEEEKDELVDGIIKSINENLEILSKEVYNDRPEDFGVKPLHIIADLESDVFVEKAGNKYLFKVGELLGPQQEMYQETERKLPAENEFERSYKRKIIVEIPEGYQFKNLDNINIEEAYSKDDKELFFFKSGYVVKDNQLEIEITEFYNQNIIDLSMFESYRKVINSAANFNKVTLILEKSN